MISTEREAAENGIAAALNPLQPSEAMAALIEMQAVLLASEGILPRTPEFERFVAGHIALLASRVHAMSRVMRATAH